MRHTVYFRWHWHDDDDDDDHNNNNNNSSEDIVFITVSIIVSITRFTALSHMMLLIFATFALLNILLQLPIDFTYNTWLSNSLDKRLGQGLPGGILTLFLCSYYFSCPICPISLFSLSLSVFSGPRGPKIDRVWYIFLNSSLAFWSGAQSIVILFFTVLRWPGDPCFLQYPIMIKVMSFRLRACT